MLDLACSSSDASRSDCSPASNDLLARYNTHFVTRRAGTEEMIRTAQAIRYQVYCLERQFEKAAEHVDRLESDTYDPLAVHSLVFHRPTSDAIGTARLILARHTASGLPVQGILRANGFNAEDYFPLEATAEISRVAISNELRRRFPENLSIADGRQEKERCGVLPFLGLVQDLLRHSVALGVTHWAAVMEPKMLRMQAALGFHSTPVGPIVSYHGMRQPSYCHIASMLERLYRERPDHWMVVTDGGSLVPAELKWKRSVVRQAA